MLMKESYSDVYVTWDILTSSNTMVDDISKGYQVLYESWGLLDTALFMMT